MRDLDRKSSPALLGKEDYRCSVILGAGLKGTGLSGMTEPTTHCLTDFTEGDFNKEPPAGSLFFRYLGGSLKHIKCKRKVAVLARSTGEKDLGGRVFLELTLIAANAEEAPLPARLGERGKEAHETQIPFFAMKLPAGCKTTQRPHLIFFTAAHIKAASYNGQRGSGLEVWSCLHAGFQGGTS